MVTGALPDHSGRRGPEPPGCIHHLHPGGTGQLLVDVPLLGVGRVAVRQEGCGCIDHSFSHRCPARVFVVPSDRNAPTLDRLSWTVTQRAMLKARGLEH